jgi:sulfofructose kinase
VIVGAAGAATRVICTRAVPPLELDEAAAALVRGADWVHVDHLGWPAVVAALAGVPVRQRPRVVVDAGNPVPADRADLCDPADVAVYAPTLERLHAQYGGPDAASALAACPAPTVVATAGGAGAFGRGPDAAVHHAPGFSVPDLVSTLGAGDVFHGALLAAVVRALPLPAALRYANAVAALSCRGVDGREAIPSDDAVTHFLKENP